MILKTDLTNKTYDSNTINFNNIISLENKLSISKP
jgi:hypothetical protein